MSTDSPSQPIIGTIKHAKKLFGGNFSGQIFGDTRNRFTDGFFVNLTATEDLGNGLYKTQSGDVYKIELGDSNGR